MRFSLDVGASIFTAAESARCSFICIRWPASAANRSEEIVARLANRHVLEFQYSETQLLAGTKKDIRGIRHIASKRVVFPC